jgi:hypothetical protein
MATKTNYAQKLVEDIIGLNKKSIQLKRPVKIVAEIRFDTDGCIDFYTEEIVVERFSVKKNIFGEYRILKAEGHKITSFSEEDYNEIKRQM